MKRMIQCALSLAFAGLVLWAVLRQFDLQRAMAAVRCARAGPLALGIGLMAVAYLLRGARWLIWERTLSYWDSLRLILIGFMGNNVLPARLGEVLRSHCTSAKITHERGRTATLASIAAERILDGLVLSVFGLLGVSFASLEGKLEGRLFAVSLAFALLGFGLVLGIRFHEPIRNFIAATNRRFPGHVTAFARTKANHFLNGLLPLGTFPRMTAALAMTTLIWGVEVASCEFIGSAVWHGMNWPIALLFLVVVNFASLIPLTVGGIGTIEGITLPFLIGTGIAPYAALAMILLQHASQYLFTSVTGGVLYLTGGFYSISLASPKAGRSGPPARTVSPQPVMEETRSSLSQLGETVELRPTRRDDIDLSIVIPAYNEQARLPRTVLEAIRWCTGHKQSFELIISDDGSQDATLALARLFEESDARVRALVCPHMGKGAAVRMGVLNARGRFVLFMDADGATPMAEIPRLYSALESGYDVAIGSRVMQSPGEVQVKTPIHRKVIGRVFAFFVNLFAIEGIGDTQCGFKMFQRDAAAAIFSRQKLAGFAFDAEILFIAHKLSFSILELPVNWVAQPGSKVNLAIDSIKMLKDIVLIRWLHRNFPSVTTIAPVHQFNPTLDSGSEAS